MRTLRLVPVIAALVLAAATAATTSAGGSSLVHVRYATSFGNFGRDAYVYVAAAKGYFPAPTSSPARTSG